MIGAENIDLEWPLHTLLHKRCIFQTHHKNLNEDRPTPYLVKI